MNPKVYDDPYVKQLRKREQSLVYDLRVLGDMIDEAEAEIAKNNTLHDERMWVEEQRDLLVLLRRVVKRRLEMVRSSIAYATTCLEDALKKEAEEKGTERCKDGSDGQPVYDACGAMCQEKKVNGIGAGRDEVPAGETQLPNMGTHMPLPQVGTFQPDEAV